MGLKRVVLLAVSLVVGLPSTATAALLGMTTEPAGEAMLVSLAKMTFSGGGWVVACDMRFELTLWEEAIGAEEGNSIGQVNVNGAFPANCEGANVIGFGAGFPWDIEYAELLPADPDMPAGTENVSGLLFWIDRFEISFSTLGGLIVCSYRGDIPILVRLEPLGEAEYVTDVTLVLDEIAVLVQIGGSEVCPAEGTADGAFEFEPPQTISKI